MRIWKSVSVRKGQGAIQNFPIRTEPGGTLPALLERIGEVGFDKENDKPTATGAKQFSAKGACVPSTLVHVVDKRR